MARIRTIKPEFWTDPKILECSTNARLLFLGMLNFADDEGNIEGSSKSIKAKIFPTDDIEIEPLLDELWNQCLINDYVVNKQKYYNIQSFKKHQKIDRPGKPRCPLYEDSTNTPRVLDEPSPPEGKGSSKGRELKQNPFLYEEIIVNLKPEEKIDQNSAFEIAWKAYPVPNGKKEAKRHFNATVKTKADWLRQIKAFNYYGDYVVAQNQNGKKRSWQDGSTFFNNWEEWAEKAEKLEQPN